ncbi:MAG: DUF3579 domain-containing protein [Parasulfuritortus sp.]|jgi:hypothetical protein|nr:DUF3579 domain-containing protein [Parasulfuritortus sp.]
MSTADSDEPPSAGCFTILGLTNSGRKFRPSDWSCRLAGPYGKVEQNVIRYHPDVQPINCNGQPGVRVSTTNPAIATHLEAFAAANDLVVVREA